MGGAGTTGVGINGDRRIRSPTMRLLFLLTFTSSSAAMFAGDTYRTAYACEGTTLNIECQSGQVINVIRANYGRFSITICNAQGNTEWSVNCQSPRTRRVLGERCGESDRCVLPVSSQLFGDPCPGTLKYIEIHYSCRIAAVTTSVSRPRPPWLVATGSLSWLPSILGINYTTASATFSTISTIPSTTTTTSIATSATTSVTTTTSSKAPVTRLSNVTEEHTVTILAATTASSPTPFTITEFPTSSSTVPPIQTSTPISSKQAPPLAPPSSVGEYYGSWCPPSFGRGLYWNWTRGGEVAIQPCPGGASGWARRSCSFVKWAGPADLSECHSVWLATLETRAHSHDSVLGVATDLALVTANKALYGGDLITTARLLSTLSTQMTEYLNDFPDLRQRQALVTEMLQAALSTGSALLATGMAGPWGDLVVHERHHAITHLMVALEEISFLLAGSLSRGIEAAYFKSHVLVSVRSTLADGSSVDFPSDQDKMLEWGFVDQVTLPPEAILENSDGSATKVIFLTYRHLEDLLKPGPEPLRNHGGNITLLVNSRVVSASMGYGRHIQLPEPVTLTFSLLRQENMTRPICVFWDYTTADWSDEGCRVVLYNRSHVKCQCDHLSNFAVLMEEGSSDIGEDHQSTLHILTYVGCSLSLLFLAGSILVFSVLPSLVTPQTTVHRQVCICLSGAELVFLVGIWRNDVPVLCGVIAGVLHFSVLSAFAWMLVEGVHLYQSVTTRDFECDSPRVHWWHYTLAYGLPLLVVAAAAVVDPFSFGTEQYCWLRTDNYFFFSLVGPALLLLATHVALLAAALIYSCRPSPDDAFKTKEMARLASARTSLRGSVTLILLMALTWSMGILFLRKPSLPLAVGFCVLIALQGIFVFIYFCIKSQKVQEWCRSAAEREAWLPQVVRGVFAAEKQTYSPSNNDTNPNPTVAHALASPSLNQYFPTLCQICQVQKQPGSTTHPPVGQLLSGVKSIMGSGGSRQQGVRGHLPLDTLHPSLPHYHNTVANLHITSDCLPHASLDHVVFNHTGDICCNSYSRISGRGGSEPDDSTCGECRINRQLHFDPSTVRPAESMEALNIYSNPDNESNLKTVLNNYESQDSPAGIPSAVSTLIKRDVNATHSHSPWHHTYMEIERELDPVYEELEKEHWRSQSTALNETIGHELLKVSDLSDDYIKRGTPSDVSRQSSRSNGDARPLLPRDHSQSHQFLTCNHQDQRFLLSEERLRDFNAAQMTKDLEQFQKANQYNQCENLMTVALLNGEKVVCRLASPSNAKSSLPVIHETSSPGIVSHISQLTNGHPVHLAMPHPVHHRP